MSFTSKSSNNFFSHDPLASDWFDGSYDENENSINLTPLIDVVFNLLIFFLLSASFTNYDGNEKKNNTMNVQLPKNESATNKEISSPILLELSAAGKILVDSQSVQFAELNQTLRKKADEQKNSTAPGMLIMADQHVEHGQVVNIMSEANKAGITNIGFAAEQIAQ